MHDGQEANWWDAADHANAVHQAMIEAQVDLWDAYDAVKAKQARYQALRQEWTAAEVEQETLFRKWIDGAMGIPSISHVQGQQVAS